MAVTVNQAMEQLHARFTEETVAEVEKHVDECMTDPQYLKSNLRGSAYVGYWYVSIFTINVTPGDRREIIRRYTAAGWHNVSIRSSEEEGGNAGKYVIQLALPPGTMPT